MLYLDLKNNIGKKLFLKKNLPLQQMKLKQYYRQTSINNSKKTENSGKKLIIFNQEQPTTMITNKIKL